MPHTDQGTCHQPLQTNHGSQQVLKHGGSGGSVSPMRYGRPHHPRYLQRAAVSGMLQWSQSQGIHCHIILLFMCSRALTGNVAEGNVERFEVGHAASGPQGGWQGSGQVGQVKQEEAAQAGEGAIVEPSGGDSA